MMPIKQLFSQKSKQITALATVSNTILVFLAWGLCQIVLGFFKAKIAASSHQASILDLQFAYSAETAYSDFLDKYTIAARSYYLQAVCVDLIYPIVYSFFLAFLLSFSLKNTKLQHLNILPFAAAFFDYFENAGIVTLLASYPERLLLIASLTSFFGAMKWIAVFFTLLVLFGAFLWKIQRFLKK